MDFFSKGYAFGIKNESKTIYWNRQSFLPPLSSFLPPILLYFVISNSDVDLRFLYRQNSYVILKSGRQEVIWPIEFLKVRARLEISA